MVRTLTICCFLLATPASARELGDGTRLAGEVAAGAGISFFAHANTPLNFSSNLHGALEFQLVGPIALLADLELTLELQRGLDGGSFVWPAGSALIGVRLGREIHLDVALGAELTPTPTLVGPAALARAVFPLFGAFALHVQSHFSVVFASSEAVLKVDLSAGVGAAF